MYGHRFVSSFGEKDDGTWLSALRDLSPEQIAKGLHACINNYPDWPPALGQFRRLCQIVPEDLNLPSARACYKAACHGDWFHAIVYECAYRVGVFDLSSLPESVTWPRYEDAYEQVVRDILAGKLNDLDLHPPKRKLLTDDREIEQTRSVDPFEQLAKIKSMLGGQI